VLTNTPSVTYHSKAKGPCIPYVYANMTSSACPIKIQAKLVKHPISCVLVHNYERPEYSLVRVRLRSCSTNIVNYATVPQHKRDVTSITVLFSDTKPHSGKKFLQPTRSECVLALLLVSPSWANVRYGNVLYTSRIKILLYFILG
jgi:hypothetical protein